MLNARSQKRTQLLAFYLPQFHPVPENDQWWGAGFTEWTNVVKGRPLFEGHQQPHLPADLGFYDLRLKESREKQAELARFAGVDGFVYYHYWFNGRRILERPFNEVLESGKPDFPFCLCWANEPWSRNWDGESRHILMPQAYDDNDDENHIKWLIEAFKDHRYIKVEGKPMMLIYRPSHHPDFSKTAALWRTRVKEAGFPDLHLCVVQAFPGETHHPQTWGADAAVEFKPNLTDLGAREDSSNPLEIGYKLHRVWTYESLVRGSLGNTFPQYPFYPSVTPSWDNSVRRKEGGLIIKDANPEKYGNWLSKVLMRESSRKDSSSYVFINAWNEWAEGNHLEPCQRWGRGYLEATRTAKDRANAIIDRAITALKEPLNQESCSGHIDTREESSSQIRGWAYDSRIQKSAAFVAIATQSPSGFITIIALADSLMDQRHDVENHFGNASALNTGWKFTDLGSETLIPGRILVAYFEGESTWTKICNI